MNLLRRIRITVATLLFVAATLLFLDFTGTLHAFLGWVAKVQFIPALLAAHMAVVILLVLLTLLVGRLYCSVICPLGIYQDGVSRLASKLKKHRFRYKAPLTWLRRGVLILFGALLLFGMKPIANLIEPYSIFGRAAHTLLQPLYKWGNNLLAYGAERMDSYAFYTVEVWTQTLLVVGISAATLLVITIMAWRGGRSYCNTLCPVGTLLGFFSHYSLFRVQIDSSKCNGCTLCERNCKSSCINIKEGVIDYSRCVTCFDCLDSCKKGAISFGRNRKKQAEEECGKPIDTERRNMLTVTAALLGTSALASSDKKVDGGLAFIEDKKIPKRSVPLFPAGAESEKNFAQYCVSCQLCVSACPNGVLRPSTELARFMQPEMSYERGYCRPECNACSQVCPADAIHPITVAEKSSIQIGHAVWVEKNCVVLTDGVACNNCEIHCPTGAITRVHRDPNDKTSPLIPVVNAERCIGCGACENLCPARPFSAIYVEGNRHHRTL